MKRRETYAEPLRPTLRVWRGLVLVAALLGSVASHAQETVTYGYDARGRLIAVSHSGGPANGIKTAYHYDAADNRTSVTTTGASSAVIVVPLGGLKVIAV